MQTQSSHWKTVHSPTGKDVPALMAVTKLRIDGTQSMDIGPSVNDYGANSEHVMDLRINSARNRLEYSAGKRADAVDYMIWFGLAYEVKAQPAPDPWRWIEYMLNKTDNPDLILTIEYPDKVDKMRVVGKNLANIVHQWEATATKNRIAESVLASIRECIRAPNFSQCYFTADNGPCVRDAIQRPKESKPYCKPEWTEVVNCGDPSDCKDECEKASAELVEECDGVIPCDIGFEYFLPPNAKNNKFYRHCPRRAIKNVRNRAHPGRSTPWLQTPKQPSKPTQSTQSTSGSTTKPPFEARHIALIVIGCLTVLAVDVGLIICCACKKKRMMRKKHVHPPTRGGRTVETRGTRGGTYGPPPSTMDSRTRPTADYDTRRPTSPRTGIPPSRTRPGYASPRTAQFPSRTEGPSYAPRTIGRY